MHITCCENAQSICVVTLEDELSQTDITPMMRQLEDLAHNGVSAVIFDCAALQFLASYGLSILLRTRKLFRDALETKNTPNQGDLEPVHLVHVSGSILDVIRIAKLNDILPIHNEIGDAMNAAWISPDTDAQTTSSS